MTPTDWTFETTTRYGNLKSVRLTNKSTGYSTYATLWSDMGIGYDAADISPITPEVAARVFVLLHETEI